MSAAAADGFYRAVVETAADAIIVIDNAGIVLSVNGAAERLFGYAAAEIVGHDVDMHIPQSHGGEYDGSPDSNERTDVTKMIGIGREVTGLHRDGSVFPMELSVSEVQQGEERLFVGIVRDISARKRAELIRLHLAAIVESSHDAIIGETWMGSSRAGTRGRKRSSATPPTKCLAARP